MNVIILSNKKNLPQAEFFHSYFTHYHHNCTVYIDDDKLFSAIQDNRHRQDFYLVDYDYFNLLILDVYSYFRKFYRTNKPVIFFNDPKCKEDDYVPYWKEIIRLVYRIQNDDDGKIYDFLRITEAATKYFENQQKKNNLQQIPVEPVKKQNPYFLPEITEKLPSSAFIIYSTLARQPEKYVSTKELINLIKKNNKMPKEGTVYTAISKIRKAFRQNQNCRLDIIKNGLGFMLVER